jgi:hypothetical protein
VAKPSPLLKYGEKVKRLAMSNDPKNKGVDAYDEEAALKESAVDKD